MTRVFAIGAYGTNNVGDEAIFDGLSVIFPGCVPIHIGKSDRPNAVFFEDVLKNPEFFQRGDLLIVGGGGLLYDKRAIRLFIELARAVDRAGGKLRILGLGCEAADEAYYEDIRELVGLTDTVEVRSSISQEILKRITGREAVFREDFAFFLRSKINQAEGSCDDVPHIGIVTSGDYLEDISELCRVIKTFTATPKVKFHHIPHSRAFFDPRNNDLTVGQRVWSSIDVYFGNREQLFFTESFSSDPTKVLNRYRKLDGVVSRRYHGLVFSKIVGIPHMGMNGESLKNGSFFADHSSNLSRISRTSADLFRTFAEFFELVRDVKQRTTVDEKSFAVEPLRGSFEDFGRARPPSVAIGLGDYEVCLFCELLAKGAAAAAAGDLQSRQEIVAVLKKLSLPPFATIAKLLDRKAERAVDNSEVSRIIKELLSDLPFNEGWYVTRYPDIAKAIARGSIQDARSHYIDLGYFEGRRNAP
ncbi:polysaccharide pyruvyl transferase family protein [Bradyrhizobium sp. USDA 3650]